MFQELLSKLAGDEVVVLTLVVGALLLAAVAIVAHHWRQVRVAELQAALKRQMIERGISAADIDKVLQAPNPPEETEDTEEAASFTGNPAEDKTRLVSLLLDNSYEAEQIERILRAFHDPACHAPDSTTLAQKAATLKVLIENGLEVEDIEKVLHGFDGAGGQQTTALPNMARCS
jgi:hypothetical protein